MGRRRIRVIHRFYPVFLQRNRLGGRRRERRVFKFNCDRARIRRQFNDGARVMGRLRIPSNFRGILVFIFDQWPRWMDGGGQYKGGIV